MKTPQDKVRRIDKEHGKHGTLAFLGLRQAWFEFFFERLLDVRICLGRQGAGLQPFHPALFFQE